MFWKKKKTSIKKFIHESEDKRETFRFVFDHNDIFQIEFLNKTINLIDLSAAGISFQNHGFNKNDHGKTRLIFDFKRQNNSPIILEPEVHIIKIDKNNICRGIFKNFPKENKEIIHKYILEKQKEKIRRAKSQ